MMDFEQYVQFKKQHSRFDGGSALKVPLSPFKKHKIQNNLENSPYIQSPTKKFKGSSPSKKTSSRYNNDSFGNSTPFINQTNDKNNIEIESATKFKT